MPRAFLCSALHVYKLLCAYKKPNTNIAIITTIIYFSPLYKKFQALRQIKIDLQLSQQTISLFNSKSYMSIEAVAFPQTDLTFT
jgi:hypothetical protein